MTLSGGRANGFIIRPRIRRFSQQGCHLSGAMPTKPQGAMTYAGSKPRIGRSYSSNTVTPAEPFPKNLAATAFEPDIIKTRIIAEEFFRRGSTRALVAKVFPCSYRRWKWAHKNRRAVYPSHDHGRHDLVSGLLEPGAGSDLAALSTAAVLDGDEWVINGQKIWTSTAQIADWIFVVQRT